MLCGKQLVKGGEGREKLYDQLTGKPYLLISEKLVCPDFEMIQITIGEFIPNHHDTITLQWKDTIPRGDTQ